MSASTPIWSRQLILVTGKGGVGKTTIAAALARAAHTSGRRVLLTEVAPDTTAPSPVLSLFGHPLVPGGGEEPVLIQPGFWGVRLSPSIGHKLFLRTALRVKIVVDAAMRSAALTRFLLAAPTFPEIGILYQLVSLIRSRNFDHIIVDLPATGHALALATLPRTVNRIVPTGLIGDAIKEGLDVMTDPNRTATVVVTLPESMPVTESVELIEALTKHKIPVAGAILNRLPTDPFTHDERTALEELMKDLAPEMLLGARELRRLSRALAARNAFHAQIPPGILRIEIPLLEADEDRARIDPVLRVLERADAAAAEEARREARAFSLRSEPPRPAGPEGAP